MSLKEGWRFYLRNLWETAQLLSRMISLRCHNTLILPRYPTPTGNIECSCSSMANMNVDDASLNGPANESRYSFSSFCVDRTGRIDLISIGPGQEARCATVSETRLPLSPSLS